MRPIMTAVVIAALLMPAAAMAGGFHVDEIVPGEGAESDCFTAFWRTGAKPVNGEGSPRDVFEIVDDHGFIKIDGVVRTLQRIKGARSNTYSAGQITVFHQTKIVRTVKSSDGNSYYLKGSLKVTDRDESQSLAVSGESFCYSGE